MTILFCLLFSSRCFPFTAFCPLLTAYSSLPGAFRLLLPVSCLLPISSVWLTDYWSLMTDHSFFTAYCLLPSAYFSLPFPLGGTIWKLL